MSVDRKSTPATFSPSTRLARSAASRLSGWTLSVTSSQVPPVETFAVRRSGTTWLGKLLSLHPELGFLNGHVPVTGILSAIAVMAALLDGRDAVVMSNEWSASVATVQAGGRAVNHQYSKSMEFEAGFRQVLAGALGNEGISYEMMYADPVNARRGEGMRGQPVAAPELVAPSADPAEWIRSFDSAVELRDVEVVAGSPGDWSRALAEAGLTFRIAGQARPLSLVPLNRLFGQRYAVYWRVRQA